MSIRYDDSLPLLLRFVELHFGDAVPTNLAVMRDMFGRLAVLVEGQDKNARTGLSKTLVGCLGPYAVDGATVIDAASPLGRDLLDDQHSLWRVERFPESGREVTVRTIDRRLVGQDWVLPPSHGPGGAPRLVFASLKGGVGRSTALSVTAAHLAQRGLDVLAIDLDIEAPGLGSMLVTADSRPRQGALDYLVENGRGGVSDDELDEFVATSELTDRFRGQGRVDVVPAAGRACADNPHNVIGKLARALVEDLRPGGGTISLRDQTREMVDRLAARRRYDAVLIDSRAGLAEMTSGPLLGLDATVLLFGIDQPQTFEGYSYLLAHLAQLQVRDENDWRHGFRFVQAKAPASPDARRRFRDDLFDLFADHFYESEDRGAFNFGMDEPGAPHDALCIGFDGGYLDFDPVRDHAHLDNAVYKAAFGDFLSGARGLLRLE
ncbi:MAG: ParA family protein [Alphaproteobacteria bacterium]|nr:ParA family protein [Alphaproteobacteria bacterium]